MKMRPSVVKQMAAGMRAASLLAAAVLSVACGSVRDSSGAGKGNRYARYFELLDSAVVSISPYDGHRDTVRTTEPVETLVCFSSSYVGFLSALGCQDVAAGVSGVRYITDPVVRTRAVEVGYEANPDYEAIFLLHPDLLLTYTISPSEPTYITKLLSIKTKVLVLYEHLENHPLARSEYLRLFGALTHREKEADSLFSAIEKRYLALSGAVDAVREKGGKTQRVLLNIPYNDQWYVPGTDSYMAQLIRDAGGEISGARAGVSGSTSISVEEAFALSQEADCWLHPGWCRSRADLRSVHPLFPSFPVLERNVWNNTLRTTPEGGNDFWESGAVRADLVLEDLVRILHPETELPEQARNEGGMTYYVQLQ